MQLHERLIRTVAQLQRWPTVDLRRMDGKLPESRKEHIILENCKVVIEGRGNLHGFILVHEDGSEEHFGILKARERIAKDKGAPPTIWRSRFNFMEPKPEARL